MGAEGIGKLNPRSVKEASTTERQQFTLSINRDVKTTDE